MANSFGTLTPDIITLSVMDYLKKKFPIIKNLATDFSPLPVDFGETVKSRVVTVPTVADYDTTNGYVPGDAATTDVDVTINKHKHVSLSFGEQEISGTKRNLAEEQMSASAYALGRQMLVDLGALITPGNFPTSEVATVANTDRSTLGLLRENLTNQGAAYPRYGLVNPGVFANLTDDSRLINVNFQGGGEDVDYEMGMIRNALGFGAIGEWADMPTANNLTGFFANKNALVIASRVPKDPALVIPDLQLPGTIKIITDPETGMTMMYRFFYDMKLGKLQMTLTWMYGVNVGVAGQGTLLTSA